MPAAKRGATSGEAGKPVKQRKTAKAAARAPLGASSFEHFSKLPNELQTRIVSLACSSPAVSSAASDASSPIGAHLDRPTILGIALVSRGFYAQAAPLIYARVRLERPSRLKLFQQTLSARPALGRLVRSLHIGPDDELPSWWWPLDRGKPPARRSIDAILWGDPILFIRAGLRGRTEDESALPVWCKPDRQWSLNKSNKDCRARAVFSALEAAARAIDVGPLDLDRSWSGKRIGRTRWLVRMMELQASLDLFLLEVRRVDDREADAWHLKHGPRKGPGCPDTGCPRYPHLDIVGAICSSRKPANDEADGAADGRQDRPPALTISRAQLVAHLGRRGSISDRFDHPLLFARSGVDYFVLDGPGRAGHDDSDTDPHGVTYPRLSWEDDSEDFADLFSEQGMPRDTSAAASSPADTTLDPLLPNTATLGSLLALARSVLGFTPKLTNLSLTGFLERAVCGERGPPSLNVLKCLTVGPPPPYYYTPLNFGGLGCSRLEKVRVCGVMLLEQEIQSLSGWDLHDIKEIQWVMAGKYSEKHPIASLPKLNTVARRILRLKSSEGKDPLPELSGRENEKAPLVEMRLHPDDIASLLEDAAIKKALQDSLAEDTNAKGDDAGNAEEEPKSSNPRPRRLRLTESRAATADHERGFGGTDEGTLILYEEGREWWERCGAKK